MPECESNMKVCQSCGRQLRDEVGFCDGCGAPQPRRIPGPTKFNPMILAVVLLLVGLVIGFVIGAAIYSGTQRVVTQQLTTTGFLTTTIQTQGSTDLIEYCFASPHTPHGDCASRLIYWFGQAKTSIHIMIYSFTLDDVGDALVQAKQHGVDVKIAWDKTEVNGSGSEYQKLVTAGIDIRIDHETGIDQLHDKVAVIDGHLIITGSFNWSANANLHDRENLVVIDSATWGAAYEQNFQEIWNASG